MDGISYNISALPKDKAARIRRIPKILAISVFMLAIAPFLYAQPPADVEASATRPAMLIVQVHPEATLEVQGKPSGQKGEIRRFQTKRLQADQEYEYSFKAIWEVDGEEKVRETTVRVHAGEEKFVDFREAEALTSPPNLLSEIITEPPIEVRPTPPGPPPTDKLDPPIVPARLESEQLPFRLVLPAERIDLAAGETKIIDFKVVRVAYDDAISFKLLGVPASIAVQLAVIDAEAATVRVTLRASEKPTSLDAEIGCLAVGGGHSAGKRLRVAVIPLEP